jgi:hypothetical protein
MISTPIREQRCERDSNRRAESFAGRLRYKEVDLLQKLIEHLAHRGLRGGLNGRAAASPIRQQTFKTTALKIREIQKLESKTDGRLVISHFTTKRQSVTERKAQSERQHFADEYRVERLDVTTTETHVTGHVRYPLVTAVPLHFKSER